MRVLLAGVVAADEGWVGEEGCAVGEFVIRPAFGFEGQVRVERDAAEDDDYLGVFEEFEFLFEVGAAVGDFFGEWLVGGGSAVDGAGDPGVCEFEAVAGMGAGWLIGEAGVAEGLEKEIAGTVTGEDAAGAVGAVCGGGETDDDEARVGVTERGDGAAPVLFIAVGAALDAGDGLTVLAEAGAEVAGDDLALEVLQAHSIQSTMRAYDTTNGSGGSGGRGGNGSGFEARVVGRGSGADGGVSGMACVGGE